MPVMSQLAAYAKGRGLYRRKKPKLESSMRIHGEREVSSQCEAHALLCQGPMSAPPWSA